ncbi:phosphatidylserine decarboxylase 1 [Orobanche minor]
MADPTRPEFDILDSEGLEYHRWVSDVETTFIAKDYSATIFGTTGDAPSDKTKASALMFLRRHIDPSLRWEYLQLKYPKEMWDALKGRFGNIHNTLLPELTVQWNEIRLLDYKRINDFNKYMLRLKARLNFCGKDITEDDMIQKTLSTFPTSMRVVGRSAVTIMYFTIFSGVSSQMFEKYIEEARSKGVELEFHPDVKARFLRLLPLRNISRSWGSLTVMEPPIWLRPFVYKSWARAFHSNLEEAQLHLKEYTSLREFFVRMLREGARPINSDPYCLVTGSKILGPVDGTTLRFGELRGPGAMIEQVKGCSYRASSLLGANSHLPVIAAGDAYEESDVEENSVRDVNQKSWWKISFASPKVRDTASSRVLKGLFYCVIYLKPGDYHRIHSPVDWNILVRRCFTGHLFPVNEHAVRTIRNLYVENERVIIPLLGNLKNIIASQ